MKKALELCSLANTDNAAAPTAGLVKVENGEMVAYGGLFCIRVPVENEIGCAFDPSMVKNFFRKERERFSCTVKNKKLILADGPEKLTVGCLPVEDMVTLDVVAKTHKATLNVAALKLAADVISPLVDRECLAGVTFRDGFLYGSDSKMIVAGKSGLDEDLPEFAIHKEAALALTKFKATVVKIACDGAAVKFIFDDKSSLSTLLLVETLPDVCHFFEGSWTPLKMSKATAEDLLKIDCEKIIFFNGTAHYITGPVQGEIEDAVNKKVDVKVNKKHLDTIIKHSTNFDIKISEDGFRVQGFGEDLRIITATYR